MADAKITALTELTSALSSDVIVIVDDPGGTPITKKVTLANTIVPLATTTGINAKTVAATTLYTVPTGKKLIVDKVVVRVTAFTVGSKTIQAVAQFGANSPNFNDQFPTYAYTFTANNMKILNVDITAGEFPIHAAASVFTINITTGSNATTETWAVDLWGYLVDA